MGPCGREWHGVWWDGDGHVVKLGCYIWMDFFSFYFFGFTCMGLPHAKPTSILYYNNAHDG